MDGHRASLGQVSPCQPNVEPQSQPRQARRRLVLDPAQVTTARDGDRPELTLALRPVHE